MSNKTEGALLPEKYQGCTPGEWFEDECFDERWILARQGDGRELYLATVVDSDEENEYEPDDKVRRINARLMADAPSLAAENARLREALRFYAAEEPDRCTMVIGPKFTGYSDVFMQFEADVIDRGEIARAALGKDAEGVANVS